MTEADWMRVWQKHSPSDADPDRIARAMMAQVWKVDQKVFRRNAREYAAGIVLLVVFSIQLGTGHDRASALVGIVSIGFVMVYLWWKHRDLRPLDPGADVASYRAALEARYDDQIRLLRTVPYWYGLPLCVWPIWVATHAWHGHHPAAAIVMLLVVFGTYAGIGWLNVVWGVRRITEKRRAVESMAPRE